MALDQLVRVGPDRGTSGVFDALRVKNHDLKPGFFGTFPAAHIQARADLLPRAIDFTLEKKPVHRASGRLINRQIPPHPPVFEDVQDGVHNFHQQLFAASTHNQQRLQVLLVMRG